MNSDVRAASALACVELFEGMSCSANLLEYASRMSLPHRRVSLEEYLALERTSKEKHEFVNGEMYAMAGGTPLPRCDRGEPGPSTWQCASWKFMRSCTNPTLLVEVLSESTEAYDRGAKFAHYERISSLAEYLLVSADGRRMEHFRRIETGQWLRTAIDASVDPAPVLELPTIGAKISLGDVMEGLEIFGGRPS